MKKGRLNVTLLANIFEVCGREIKKTLREAGISYTTWVGWINSEKGLTEGSPRERGGVPVERLVKLCNTLRVPVSRLFYAEGDVVVVPARHELVVPSTRYCPVKFDMETFRLAFGKRSRAKLTLEEMFLKLGVTEVWFRRWIREGNSTLRVASLEHVCDTFDYDIFDFFDDGNRLDGEDVGVSEGGIVADKSERLLEENEKLVRENENLFKENKELKELVAVMKDEMTRLEVQKSEQAYEIVRLKQHIAKMEKGFTGMAAED